MNLHAGSLAEYAPPKEDDSAKAYRDDMAERNEAFLDRLMPQRIAEREAKVAQDLGAIIAQAVEARDKARMDVLKRTIDFGLIAKQAREEDLKFRRAKKAISLGASSFPIISAVAEGLDTTIPDIVGSSRLRPHVDARSLSAQLLRNLTTQSGEPRFSLPMIGRVLGGRDHSTICNLLATFPMRCKRNPKLAQLYLNLSRTDAA